MSRKRLIYLFLPLILISCASVDSHLQKNDPKAARAFCDSKKGSERIVCLEKVVNYHLERNNYNIPAKIYMELGDETGDKIYHIKAADAYVSVIDPTKMFASQFAFIIMYYEKGGETNKALKYLKGYIATENFPTKHKSHVFVREYSLLLNYPEGVVAAAEIAAARGNYKDAEAYYTEIGKKEMIPEMWKQIGLERLKNRKYRKAAEALKKAKQPLLEKEAYIAGAKRALSLKEPLYDYAMENYKLAGDEPEGKRQVAMLLISKKNYKRALTMAKTVSPQFYTEALIKAGDKSLDWSTSSAIPYYQKANLKNYQCRIGDYFLKQKKPDFKKAEDWYGQAEDRSCQSRLLLKAIELDNVDLIQKYAGNAKNKKVLQTIAKTAIANDRPALAAMSYEKAGNSKEAQKYWKIAYKNSIDKKQYYDDYKSTWKGNSPQAQSLFWEMIQTEAVS